MYQIYRGYHGAYCICEGYTEDGTEVQIKYVRSCNKYTVSKEEFEKYFTFVGVQKESPVWAGVRC